MGVETLAKPGLLVRGWGLVKSGFTKFMANPFSNLFKTGVGGYAATTLVSRSTGDNAGAAGGAGETANQWIEDLGLTKNSAIAAVVGAVIGALIPGGGGILAAGLAVVGLFAGQPIINGVSGMMAKGSQAPAPAGTPEAPAAPEAQEPAPNHEQAQAQAKAVATPAGVQAAENKAPAAPLPAQAAKKPAAPAVTPT